jgi:MFS family permease
MTRELMQDFHIGAGSLGMLSALYFYAYVAMQIPTGILVDSWGPRKLLLAGSLTAAAGTFLFGSTSNLLVACVARGVVGGATAVAWVVTLKLVTHWFPPQRFATLSGLSLFVGNIGALFAQVPLRLLVERFTWRTVTFGSAGVVLLIFALAILTVRADPSERGYLTYAPQVPQAGADGPPRQILRGLGNILTFRNTWLIFLAQGGFLGGVLAFAGLWGPPFLQVRYGLDSKAAAAVCSVMLACFAVASPVLGAISDRIGRRKPLYLSGAVLTSVGWAVLSYRPSLSLAGFVAIAAFTSFCAAAIILGFAFGKESVPQRYLGTITGLINMGNMLGPMLLQPGIGWLLDRRWSGATANGLRVYSVESFRAAFGLIVAWSVLTVLLASLTKETYCKPLVESGQPHI